MTNNANSLSAKSGKLSTLTIIFFLITIIVPNFILAITEHLSVWGRITNVLLPAAVYCLLASVSRHCGRTILFMFPLMFLAAFQDVLLYLYGNSVIAVDMFLNLVTTNASEVNELLSNIWPSILIVIILYVPSLAAAAWMIKTNTLLPALTINRLRKTGCLGLAAGLSTLAASYMSGDYSIAIDLYPVNVCYNIGLAVDRTIKTEKYHKTSSGFRFNSKKEVLNDSTTREIAIVIIGETSRAENWQIFGYNRPTNPLLAQEDSLLAGHFALSESNTTHKSVPMLLSQIDANSFNEIYHIKSIISAFSEAGYKTAFFSNQRRNHSFIDFFGEEADTTVFIKESAGESANAHDIRLADYVVNILKSKPQRQLIVLHGYGSHFNYNERYTDRDRLFIPDTYPEAKASERPNLVNAYDNTIVATDRLLSSIIDQLREQTDAASFILYTSDHGEDIYDDNKGHFLHASPLPTWHQLNVPFVAWLSPRYNRLRPDMYGIMHENMQKEISSSRSYFHTALGLAGITTDVSDSTASLASPAYTPREHPIYLNDHNKAITDFPTRKDDN